MWFYRHFILMNELNGNGLLSDDWIVYWINGDIAWMWTTLLAELSDLWVFMAVIFKKNLLLFSNIFWPLFFKYFLTVIIQIFFDRYFSNIFWQLFFWLFKYFLVTFWPLISHVLCGEVGWLSPNFLKLRFLQQLDQFRQLDTHAYKIRRYWCNFLLCWCVKYQRKIIIWMEDFFHPFTSIVQQTFCFFSAIARIKINLQTRKRYGCWWGWMLTV